MLCSTACSELPHGKKTYKVVSGKGVRVSYKKMPLWGKIICIAYIAIILLLAVGVPYFSVVATSLFRTVSGGLSADNLTFDNYIELFESGGRGVNAILISLFLAVTSATIASVLGTIICTFSRRKNRLYKAPEAVSMLPEMLPAIVLVVGIMLIRNALYKVIPLYNTLGIMVVAYVAIFLPYSIQYVTSAYTQFGDNTAANGTFSGA